MKLHVYGATHMVLGDEEMMEFHCAKATLPGGADAVLSTRPRKSSRNEGDVSCNSG